MFKALLPRTLFLISLVLSSHCLAGQSAVALLYHHVDTSTPASTSISPERFIEHLDIIHQQGFTVLPLLEILDKLKNNHPLPEKTVAITFDDGYVSIYKNALKALKSRNMPFTVFINPQAVEKNYGDSMTWQQLRELQENGGTIANHGNHHQHLLARLDTENKQQWLDRITQNILTAQKSLETNLNIQHKLFAYPYGEFDLNIMGQLQALNFISFGQQSGAFNRSSNFQAIPRFPAAGIYSNPETLLNKLQSLAFSINQPLEFREPLKEGDASPTLTLSVDAEDVASHTLQCYYQGQAIKTQVEKRATTLTIQANPEILFTAGRHRYNCTAKSISRNQYYWFSMPYVALKSDNSFAD